MSQSSLNTRVLDELRALVAARWEDRLSKSMAARLEAVVRDEPGACDAYISMMYMHADLYQYASLLCETSAEPSLEQPAIESEVKLDDAMVMNAIGEEALTSENSIPAEMHNSAAASLAQDALRIAREPKTAARPKALARNWAKQWAAAAAVFLVSATALILILHHFHHVGALSPEPIAMGASFDATWAGETPAAAGEKVQMGIPQSLTSGYVELTSADGLAVVIEGPATFTVQRPGVISLDSGKLTATVPPKARGFTVNTPVTSIVDLGTEFGVTVSPSGETEVETFRGTVSITPSAMSDGSSSPTLITAGFARRISPAGEVTDIPTNKTSFVRTAEFDNWKAQPAETPYQRWQAYSQRLRHDPDLIAYYTFENTSSTGDRLQNLTSAGSSLDGVLGGEQSTDSPTWTTGRWPQKGALEFAKDTQQRVEIPSEIGGALDFSRGDDEAVPFTICLWLCRDSTPATISTSILGKGIGYAEQLALDYYGGASLRGWVRDSSAGDHDVDPKDFNSNSQLPSGWQHLVISYDPSHNELKLYRNGALIASRNDAPHSLLNTAAPLILGSREGDRHSPNADGTPSRFTTMAGRFDELAIFRRSLSAERVREIYLAEKPD